MQLVGGFSGEASRGFVDGSGVVGEEGVSSSSLQLLN